MPISLRQLTSAYELRYQNTGHVPHRNFSLGMIRDVASWEAPEGAMWDAVDVLCDLVGKVRKRGGTTSPAAGNSAATVENILGYRSNSIDAVTGLWGSAGKGGTSITSFNSGTGAATNIVSDGSVNTFACRPFQHGNLMVFPFQALGTTTNDRNKIYFAGGGTASIGTLTAGTVTANDNRITGIAPASVTASMLGSVIECDDSLGAGTHYYAGRIVEVTSTSAIRVEPVPTAAFTISSGAIRNAWESGAITQTVTVTGRYGCSFQNRIVLGASLITQGTASANYAKGLDFKPNRILWSILPTEAGPQILGANMDGLNVLFGGSFTGTTAAPYYNFLDFPNLGGMTALATAGEGQLLVFGPTCIYRVTGQLDTETVLAPAFDFTSGLISANVGCIAQRSIQYTRGGLIFAGFDNIYEYDGSVMKPLLSGRNQRYFQDRLRAGDRPVGSAYAVARNHYYLSMNGSDTSGLMINLDTLATTRFTNVQLFDSTPDPSDATKIWGVRWWDTTGAAPTMTKGQLIGLESIWLPTQSNASDADGTAVLASIQTKSYQDGNLEANKLFNQLHVDYALQGTGSPTVTVTADTKLNTSEASYNALTQGTLANTGTGSGVQHMDVTNQLAEGKALEVKIVQAAASAMFELNGINIGFQQRNLT